MIRGFVILILFFCFAFFLLVFLGFLIQFHQKIMTLLRCTLYEGGAVLFIESIIQLLHAFMESFLIAFVVAIIYDNRHKLAYLCCFCSRRTRSRQNRFCYLIEIGNICFTEYKAICGFCVLTTGKKSFSAYDSATGKYGDHF